MKPLTDYILEDFKISHKVSRQLYRGIKPEKDKGLCLRLAIANFNPHIDISVSHYVKNNDNSISYKSADPKYSKADYFNIKFDEKYYIVFNDYWDNLLLFDSDAIKFLSDLYSDKRQKVDLSIFTSNNKLNKSLNVEKYDDNLASLIFYEDDEINTMIKQIQTQTWNV